MSIVLPHDKNFLTDAFGSRLRDGARVGPDFARESSEAGQAVLTVASILGFYVAAREPGRSTVRALDGVVAGVMGCLLVHPLVLMSPVGHDLRQVLLTLGTAGLVGGLTAALHAHARGRL